MPVISAFGRLRQKDNEFKASLGYDKILFPKKKKNQKGRV
jgi:hypothetical protein